ncbi:MAG: endolytic transglycosylase MltG [Pontibacterium sp.]
MSRRLIYLISLPLVALIIVALLAWQAYQSFLETPVNISEPYVLTVKKGSNYNKLIAELNADKLIDSVWFMKLYGRQSQKAARIRAGEYLIEPGTTPVMLVETLVSGKPIQYSFTIVEGSTFKEVKQQLSQDKVLVQRLPEQDEKALFGKKHPGVEGLFLAETYRFERGTTDIELLQRAAKLLDRKLAAAWALRTKPLPYKTSYDALIMASIIEKETARPAERPEIAGVFVRRLNKGMRLQTDPTVIYGMGDLYKGNIRRADLRKATPYNTYVIKGLPPTPIAMVGEAAIQAALNPKPGKSLYFVAKGDGSHQFSNTLKAHNRAVRLYQLKRRKDYRSTP